MIAQPAGEHIGEHREILDQVKLLKDHGDIAPVLSELRSFQIDDGLALEEHIAFGGFDQAVDAPEQGGFPASGKAQQDDEILLLGLKGEAIQGIDLTIVAFVQIFYGEDTQIQYIL